MDNDLLEILTKEAGGVFISDLRYIIKEVDDYSFINNINFNDYTENQWQEALKYLTGKEIKVSSIEEVKQCFINNKNT